LLPKISIVIPCYNAKPYIAATIQSVLAQDWPDLEILVVDDGSSDGSAAMVESMFPSVRLIRQVNQGVAAARNHGIGQAFGEWIAFLDADDIWLPGKLHAQWAMLQKSPGARMSYTAWQVWASTEPEPASEYLAKLTADAGNTARWAGASGWVYPHLLLDCVVWTSTVLVHKSVFLEAGVFDPSLRIGEDYDLWLRASRITPILRVPRPLALYRMHPASITRSVPEKNFRALVVGRALRQWGYASPDGSVADQRVVRNALAKSWSDYAGAHLDAGNLPAARQAGVEALRNDWRHTSGLKVWVKAALKSLASPSKWRKI
jgi:glycosyltransferase involved in cell wall biosynthesis